MLDTNHLTNPGKSENTDEIAESTSSKSSTDRKHTYSGSSNTIAADRVTTELAAPPAPASNLGSDIETIQPQLVKDTLPDSEQASHFSVKHLPRQGRRQAIETAPDSQYKSKKQVSLE